MKIDLSNKNFLVTGGAGFGVGSGICKAIDNAGGTLVINDLSEEKIQEAISQYKKAIGIRADVSKSEEVKRLFNEIKKQIGPLHGVVNNAGIGHRKPAHMTDLEEFDALFNTNFKAAWMISKAFAQDCIEHQIKGNIINISSVHAFNSTNKYSLYASTKGALNNLTRGLSIEWGKYGIRCNGIAPGYVDSAYNVKAVKEWSDDPEQWIKSQIEDYQSIPKVITSTDCGNAAVFLLSEYSKSITGQIINVDSGFTNLLYSNSFLP
jgi:gluconate 5-dehydrogenase